MCKFTGKSNEQILCKLSKSEILRLYSIVHVAMETTKTSNFICQSRSFVSIFFTCQVSAHELQPFSYHHFANDIYSQTAKTVFSHLKDSPLDSWTHEILWCHHWKNLFGTVSFERILQKGLGIFFLKLTQTAILLKGLNIPCLNLHLNHVWSRFSGCPIVIVIFHQDTFIHVIRTAWMFI